MKATLPQALKIIAMVPICKFTLFKHLGRLVIKGNLVRINLKPDVFIEIELGKAKNKIDLDFVKASFSVMGGVRVFDITKKSIIKVKDKVDKKKLVDWMVSLLAYLESIGFNLSISHIDSELNK